MTMAATDSRNSFMVILTQDATAHAEQCQPFRVDGQPHVHATKPNIAGEMAPRIRVATGVESGIVITITFRLIFVALQFDRAMRLVQPDPIWTGQE